MPKGFSLRLDFNEFSRLSMCQRVICNVVLVVRRRTMIIKARKYLPSVVGIMSDIGAVMLTE